MEVGRVVAVVVTFNRKALLLQALDALTSQTRPLDKIIVIDNASSDGTGELLREHGVLDNPTIRYVRSEKNTGGSGGFHAGMALALEENADWIWVMDDDVAATPTCLATLLEYRDVSECIHPRKFFPSGLEYQSEQFQDILTGGRYGLDNHSFKNGKKVLFNNTATFEGMLVSRSLVERVGLPDAKYFICEDDMLFAIKASVHTNISHTSDAIIKKLLDDKPMPPWKSYYWIRNHFFVFRDACEYLDIRPSYAQRVKFTIIQLLEVLRLSYKKVGYFRPAAAGFWDGFRYISRRQDARG